MKFVLVFALSLFASVSHADDRALKITESALILGYIGTSVADARFTFQCVERGVCREANPFLKPLVDRRGIGAAMSAKVAFNLGVVGGLAMISHKWPDRHKTFIAAMIAANAVNVWVLEHNRRALAR